MLRRNYPKEIERNKQVISRMENRFRFKCPPLYKSLVVEWDCLGYFALVNDRISVSYIDSDIYINEDKYRNTPFGTPRTPIMVYEMLLRFPWSREYLKDFELLVVGDFDDYFFVGVGESNQDGIYRMGYEDDELIPIKLENNIFELMSKYRVTFPINSENIERGYFEKFWFKRNTKFVRDLGNLVPRDQGNEYVELDSLVDNMYNEIMNYVQSNDRDISL